MNVHDAKGRKVVSTSDAVTVARVDRFVIDPDMQRVVAVTLKKTDGDADLLAWDDIVGFGPDAVTVRGADALQVASGRLAELADKHRDLVGKRILTDAGDELGEVQDVEFDPSSGAVVRLHTKHGDLAGARLRGLGSYAAVVRSSHG